MKVIYEEINSASVPYPNCLHLTVAHEGRQYTKAGYSFGEELSIGQLCSRFLGLIALVFASVLCLGLPFLLKSVQERIRGWWQEGANLREFVIHCVAKTPLVNKPSNTTEEVGANRTSGKGDIPDVKATEKAGVESLASWQHQAIEQVVDRVARIVRTLPTSMEGATCCIRVTWDKGGVNKQFLFPGAASSTLSHKALRRAINAIKEPLQDSLKNEIDAESSRLTFRYALFAKNAPEASGDGEPVKEGTMVVATGIDGYADTGLIQHCASKGGRVTSDLFKFLKMSPDSILNDGQFIEGPYYQKLTV